MTAANGYRYKKAVERGGSATTKEHILIAERILGRRLRPGEQVHHVNEVKDDNRHTNLVICPTASYHRLLHQRTRALNACGHADWRLCVHCGEYAPDEQLERHGKGGAGRIHLACRKAAWAAYKGRRRAA